MQDSINKSIVCMETVYNNKYGVLMRRIADNFSISEELLSIESLHGKTKGSDIFGKAISCLETLQIDSSKLVSVCTAGAPSMIGQVAGTTSMLGNFLNRPLLLYHSIIHQESIYEKTLYLHHIL